jgi:hypothetical protein
VSVNPAEAVCFYTVFDHGRVYLANFSEASVVVAPPGLCTVAENGLDTINLKTDAGQSDACLDILLNTLTCTEDPV